MLFNSPFVMLRRTLVTLGAVAGLLAFAAPASAGPLCGGIIYGDDFSDDGNGVCRNFSPGDNAKYFMFNSSPGFEHLVRITVSNVVESFGLRILPEYLAPGPIPGFPSYNCVAYGVGGTCVNYLTVHPDDHTEEYHPELYNPVTGDGDYEGPITWLIAWTQVVGIDPIPEIFHEFGDDSDDIFDEIMDGIYFSDEEGPFDFDCDLSDEPEEGDESYAPPTCGFVVDGDVKAPGDPVRVSMSDTFSSARVGQAVPEPASMTLFALLGAGCAVRLRRR